MSLLAKARQNRLIALSSRVSLTGEDRPIAGAARQNRSARSTLASVTLTTPM
jgi:hypothetical protein